MGRDGAYRLCRGRGAPRFRIHFDFNGGAPHTRLPRTVATVLPILRQLEDHPVVGFVEDPLARWDVHGWRNLRERTRIPLIMGHGGQLGTAMDSTLGMADLYMLGGGGIGNVLACGRMGTARKGGAVRRGAGGVGAPRKPQT